jgi:hypothetical protein
MFAPMVLDSSNKGDECASAHPLGKDFAFTERIATGEFANTKVELNATACAGHIP